MEDVQVGFKKPTKFPNEAFVQAAIHAYFEKAGYRRVEAPHVDLACEHPATGERWFIEAKGMTSSVGLDFNTGLGQILRRMKASSCNYGYALPLIPQFLMACHDLHVDTRTAIRLHLLFVANDGTVTVVKPTDPIPQNV